MEKEFTQVSQSKIRAQECYNLKGCLACGCAEIANVGSQDSVPHKDTEALSSKFLYFIAVTTTHQQ